MRNKIYNFICLASYELTPMCPTEINGMNWQRWWRCWQHWKKNEYTTWHHHILYVPGQQSVYIDCFFFTITSQCINQLIYVSLRKWQNYKWITHCWHVKKDVKFSFISDYIHFPASHHPSYFSVVRLLVRLFIRLFADPLNSHVFVSWSQPRPKTKLIQIKLKFLLTHLMVGCQNY